MSRILKRPMFRRGGSTNTGIMSGLVDRRNYSTGMFGSMTEDQIRSNIDLLRGLQDQFAPLPKTRLPLGEVGLALASGAPLVDALGAGYKKFVSEDDKRRALAAKREQAAVSTVLGQALKEKKTPDSKFVRNTSDKIMFGIKPGETGFVTNAEILAARGVFTEVRDPKDTRTAVLKNADALEKLGVFKNPEDKAKYIQAASIKGGFKISFDDKGQPIITQGDVPDDKEATKLARQLKIDTFKMNNAANNLFKNLEGAKTGPVGSFVTALDSTSAQLKQAADAFGFSTTGKNKTFDDTGSGAIDNYIEKNFGSFVGNDAVQLGKIKSASINLAYLMARIDEPGGRFTDRDIALKMEELGIGANPERTIAIMKNAINLRNENAAFEYGELTGGKKLDFSNMNVFGTTKETESEPGSAVPEFKILSTGEVLIKKDGKFVPYEVQ